MTNDEAILALIKDPANWTYTDPNDGYQGGGWSPVLGFKFTGRVFELAGLDVKDIPTRK